MFFLVDTKAEVTVVWCGTEVVLEIHLARSKTMGNQLRNHCSFGSHLLVNARMLAKHVCVQLTECKH